MDLNSSIVKKFFKNEETFLVSMLDSTSNNAAAEISVRYINNLFNKFKATRTRAEERAVIKQFIIRFYRLPKPNETWREIETPKYDIEVSNWGRVRFLKDYGRYKVGDIYRPSLNNAGYVNGLGGGIHVLVAKAFHGECPQGKNVDHINGNKADNRSENLQYLTPGENIRKGFLNNNKKKQKQQMKKKQSTAVEQYDKQGNLVAVYKSACAAVRANGWKYCISGDISKSCLFGHPTKGFYWKRQKLSSND